MFILCQLIGFVRNSGEDFELKDTITRYRAGSSEVTKVKRPTESEYRVKLNERKLNYCKKATNQ